MIKEFKLTTKIDNQKHLVIVSFETKGYENTPSDILEVCGLLDNAKELYLEKLKLKIKLDKNG